MTSTGVYIADDFNNRVLYYVGASTTATRVYGQGNFTTATINDGGISANSLYRPYDVFVFANSVYIADTLNNRVLQYAEAAVMTTAPTNAVTTAPTTSVTTFPSIASSLSYAPLVVMMILLSILC